MVSFDMPKNKIIFIVSPSSIGGAERYIEDLARGLKNRNYDVQIFVSHNKKYAEELTLKFPNAAHYIGDNLWEIFCRRLGLEYIEKNSIIISSGYHSLFVSLLLRIWIPFKKIKHIDIKHGWVNNDRYQRVITDVDKLLSIFCTYIVVVKLEMKSRLNMVAPKVVYIKTGIQSLIYQRKLPEKQEKIRLGLVGRIESEKRFTLGLQIANKIAEKYPTEIHIVGDGSLKDGLLKTECNKNVNRRFYGYVAREKVPYINFDILLITSITEGSPLIALEAMFLGKYIIATNVGNLAEILANGRGSIIQERNLNQLIYEISEKVIWYYELSTDKKVWIADKAGLYANKNHSLDMMVDDYIKLLW